MDFLDFIFAPLQRWTTNAITNACVELSTDISDLQQQIKGHTVQSWLNENRAAMAGISVTIGLPSLIPGVGILTTPVEIAALINMAASTSFGIGLLNGAKVYPEYDITGIFSQWAGESYSYLPLSVGLFDVTESLLEYDNAVEELGNISPDEPFAQFKIAQALNSVAVRDQQVEDALDKLDATSARIVAKKIKAALSSQELQNLQQAQGYARNMVMFKKVAALIGKKMTAYILKHFAAGLIPGAKIVLGAAINDWIFYGMTDNARKYYSHTLEKAW